MSYFERYGAILNGNWNVELESQEYFSLPWRHTFCRLIDQRSGVKSSPTMFNTLMERTLKILIK